VQLPDEYDQIYHDLEPFWGIDPKDLRDLETEHENHPLLYTFGKKNSSSSILMLNSSFQATDAKGQELRGFTMEVIDLLKPVEQFFPEFRMIYNPWDNPCLIIDWNLRNMAVQAAARKQCQ
jgi:hypothetical protein